jgi:hypothetical protein
VRRPQSEAKVALALLISDAIEEVQRSDIAPALIFQKTEDYL